MNRSLTSGAPREGWGKSFTLASILHLILLIKSGGFSVLRLQGTLFLVFVLGMASSWVHAADTYPDRVRQDLQGSAVDRALDKNPQGSVAKATGFTIELNSSERRVFRTDPLLALTARDAVHLANDFVMKTCGLHEDMTEANALLHFMMACYASYHAGIERAFPLMLAHEDNGLVDQNFESLPSNPNLPPLPENRWLRNSRMDIFNNEMGLFCGEFVRAAVENVEPRYRTPLAVLKMKQLALHALDEGRLSYQWNVSRGACRRGRPNSLHERIPRYVGDYQPMTSALLLFIPPRD